jgi:hypothetical protein
LKTKEGEAERERGREVEDKDKPKEKEAFCTPQSKELLSKMLVSEFPSLDPEDELGVEMLENIVLLKIGKGERWTIRHREKEGGEGEWGEGGLGGGGGMA